MPLPSPRKTENKKAWDKRCMANKTMTAEFKDTGQRYRVCSDIWRESRKKGGRTAADIVAAHLAPAASIRELPAGTLVRGILEQIEVRAVDEDNRQITYRAATQNGVRTFWGRSWLRMKGARLTRYRKNPVVLDSHDKTTVQAILGRGEVTVEGGNMDITVTFAEGTPRADDAWRLAKTNFLRATSVAVLPEPEKIKRLGPGETFDLGDGEVVTGPGEVLREWELAEVSMVPVPADVDTVRRWLDGTYSDQAAGTVPAAAVSRSSERRTSMDPEFKKWLEERHLDPDDLSPAALEALKTDFTARQRSADPPAPRQDQAPGQQPPQKTLAEQVREICPPELRGYADGLILRGKATIQQDGLEYVRELETLEDFRAAILAEARRRQLPLGHSEPAETHIPPAGPEGQTGKDKGEAREVKDLSVQDVAAAIRG